jgi:arylsulfatase A-like enzyme
MKRPNILFLHIDQHNLSALSANGCRDVSTPNLDRLFNRGVSFRHSCIANPVCTPSRTCWYTGLMSEEHGQLANEPEFNIDPSIADIGPLMRRGGYDPVYMGKWHIAKPVSRSFDLGFNDHEHGEVGDAYTARAAEAFLANREGNKPFFLNVGLLNPHDCCMWAYTFFPCPPAKYSLARGLLEQLPELPPNHYLSAHPTVAAGAAADPTGGRWSDQDWRYYMYCYYRSVEMVDAEVGRIVDALENSRFADNTLLIFASDHGDGLAQHYHYGKACLLDHTVIAPLVLVDPAARARRDTTHMVSNIDVTATICDYAGVDPLPGRRGLSLRPLVEGKNPAWRGYAASTTAQSRERIIRTPEFKLLNDRVTREYVLYDLVKDPWEMSNVAGNPAYAGMLAQLKATMDGNEATYHFARHTVRMLESWEKARDREPRAKAYALS